MRIVTITVTDEFGNVTNDPQKHTYQLDLETEGFDGIDLWFGDLKQGI